MDLLSFEQRGYLETREPSNVLRKKHQEQPKDQGEIETRDCYTYITHSHAKRKTNTLSTKEVVIDVDQTIKKKKKRKDFVPLSTKMDQTRCPTLLFVAYASSKKKIRYVYYR